ncbi:MAG: MarR family transcriptional regulator [Candidatus Delongbacteria bacterium]|jgi:DNA-binding MarR family transcriptional regulator|nr:MarR family transcriptional regulator [Candidatus Delongbacteria bacterium]
MDKNKITIISDIMNVMKINCQFKDKKIAAKLNITCSELNCLKQYFDADVLSVKELAVRLNIASGGVTRIVASLEEAGILRRDMDPNDRRGINVTLTKKGEKTSKELLNLSIKYFNTMFEKVSDKNMEKILTGITLLNDIWVDNIENNDKLDVQLSGSDNC